MRHGVSCLGISLSDQGCEARISHLILHICGRKEKGKKEGKHCSVNRGHGRSLTIRWMRDEEKCRCAKRQKSMVINPSRYAVPCDRLLRLRRGGQVVVSK